MVYKLYCTIQSNNAVVSLSYRLKYLSKILANSSSYDLSDHRWTFCQAALVFGLIVCKIKNCVATLLLHSDKTKYVNFSGFYIHLS